MNSVKTTISTPQVNGRFGCRIACAGSCSGADVSAGTGKELVVAVMGVTHSHGYRAGALRQPTKVFTTADSTHMFIGVEGN